MLALTEIRKCWYPGNSHVTSVAKEFYINIKTMFSISMIGINPKSSDVTCDWKIKGSCVPGRDHGGEPLHPGCAAEKGGSTLYAAASSPAALPESLQHSPHVLPASGSNATTRKPQITYTTMTLQPETTSYMHFSFFPPTAVHLLSLQAETFMMDLQ